MRQKSYLSWNDVPALIDLEQASILLGLNIESVRRYCVTKDLPAVQIGKQWYNMIANIMGVCFYGVFIQIVRPNNSMSRHFKS